MTLKRASLKSKSETARVHLRTHHLESTTPYQCCTTSLTSSFRLFSATRMESQTWERYDPKWVRSARQTEKTEAKRAQRFAEEGCARRSNVALRRPSKLEAFIRASHVPTFLFFAVPDAIKCQLPFTSRRESLRNS